MAVIDTIIDGTDVETYPKTVTAAVYDKDTNERLDNKLAKTVENTIVGQNLKMWYGTKVDYNSIVTKDVSTLYFIKDVIAPL